MMMRRIRDMEPYEEEDRSTSIKEPANTQSRKKIKIEHITHFYLY